MTLYEIINREFFDGKEFWNYYDFQANFPLESSELCKEFISDYFVKGSKMGVVMDWKFNDDKIIAFRNSHTVNVFFIGAYLQGHIDKNLSIESSTNTHINYSFSYFWYLTALAHDFGYLQEQYKIDDETMERLKCKYAAVRDMFTGGVGNRLILYRSMKWDIKYRVPCFPLQKNICYHVERKKNSLTLPCENSYFEKICKGQLKFNNGTIIKDSWYKFGLKERYFKYRLFKWNVFDHGIVGGDKFYSSIIENYRRKYLEEKSNACFMCFDDQKYKRFACDQFKVFDYIADCIGCHNIFMAGNDEFSRTMYRNYQLEELLPENYKRISYETNPLLFILCLADTLEPCKRFPNMLPCKVLDAIELSFEEDRIIVIIHKDKLENDSGVKQYAQDLNALHTWLDKTIDVNIN